MLTTSLFLASALFLACGDKDDDSGGDGGSTDGGGDGGGDGGSDGGGSDGGSDGGGSSADADNDGYDRPEDCNDEDAEIHPGHAELCNDIDDDCDEAVDEDAIDMVEMYPDADGDGFGNPLASERVCPEDIGTAWVDNGGDCRDSDPSVSPDGTELCDMANLDEDCDGLRDDQDPDTHPDTMFAFYADLDHDGYGDGSNVVMGCDAGDIRSLNQIDCDDSNDLVGPDSTCAPFDGSWYGYLNVDVDGPYGYSGTCDDGGTLTIADASSNQVYGRVYCQFHTYYSTTLDLYGDIDYPWGVSGYWQDTQNWWDGAGGETWFTGEFSPDGQSLTITLYGEGNWSGYDMLLDGDWTLTP